MIRFADVAADAKPKTAARPASDKQVAPAAAASEAPKPAKTPRKAKKPA